MPMATTTTVVVAAAAAVAAAVEEEEEVVVVVVVVKAAVNVAVVVAAVGGAMVVVVVMMTMTMVATAMQIELLMPRSLSLQSTKPSTCNSSAWLSAATAAGGPRSPSRPSVAGARS